MKVSDYIAQRLAEAGIDTAFLVQGAANNDLIYSIADRPGMRYITPMHEQAAGFMAEGWARVKQVPGLAIGTSGPGGQNLLTPLANFFYDSLPGIFITGQVNSQFMRKTDEVRQVGFQEWPAAEAFKPVTKLAKQVRHPQAIGAALDRALWAATSGRPGPALLDIPLDVQRADIDPMGIPRRSWPLSNEEEGRRASAQVSALLEDLRRAHRPVMLIGGGVQWGHARYLLYRLAPHLGIPIIPTWNALDIVPSDFPWYGGRVGTYGGPGRNFAVQNCDLLIAVGSRLSGRITGGNVQSFARGAKRVVVDVDEGLLKPENQELPFHVSIKASATDFFNLLGVHGVLNENLAERFTKWRLLADSWAKRYDPGKLPQKEGRSRGPVHPYAFARMLSDVLPPNAIIAYDCGGNAVVMNHAFRTKRGQLYFSNNGNSPMGFSMCGAMGAAFAAPERPVICVIGDGGMNMNLQELQTLRTYGLNVKVFVLNNGIYGITQQFQDTHFGGRHEASGGQEQGYIAPSFPKIAAAYGLPWFSMNSDIDVKFDFDRIFKQAGPAIIDVNCRGFKTYEPRIAGWATPIEDMTPLLPREEFRANMLIEPLPGWEEAKYGPYHAPVK